jgi:hypothetical protein
MLPKNPRLTLSASVVLAAFVLLPASSNADSSDPRSARAGLIEICPSCHKTLSKEVYYSDFYGYYRTCWRRWPNTQPPCPPCEAPGEVASQTPKAGESELELLPAPKTELEKK